MNNADACTLPYQAIKEFLNKQQCSYSSDDENHRIDLALPLGDELYEMAYWITHFGDIMHFSIQFPDSPVMSEKRLGVAEILVRANYVTDFGKFDMEMSSGEVRFHATHIIDEGYLSQGVLNRLSLVGILLVDTCQTAIRKHLQEGLSPEDVIALTQLDLEMTAEGYFLEDEE
jgi:hypothetical protein